MYYVSVSNAESLKKLTDCVDLSTLFPAIRKNCYFGRVDSSDKVLIFSALAGAKNSKDVCRLSTGGYVRVIRIYGSDSSGIRTYTFMREHVSFCLTSVSYKIFELRPKLKEAMKNARAKDVKAKEEVFTPLSSASWVIATRWNDGSLILGSNPKIYHTEDAAVTEADRLANLKPGTNFIVLKTVLSIVAGGITRTPL